MANLDPQVQIKLIDVASDLISKFGTGESGESAIKRKAGYFDTAYKALVKTVESSQANEPLAISKERRT